MPESASLAFGLAVALPPGTTGAGPTLGASVGAVASRLIVMLWLLLSPALVAVQVKVVPLARVSALRVIGSQPLWLVMVDSVSLTLQVRCTSLVYQPLLPSVPVTLGVMIGGVLSTNSSNAPMSQCGPCGRLMPRWSGLLTGGVAQIASSAASMAGLLGSKAWVNVGPPLS